MTPFEGHFSTNIRLIVRFLGSTYTLTHDFIMGWSIKSIA